MPLFALRLSDKRASVKRILTIFAALHGENLYGIAGEEAFLSFRCLPGLIFLKSETIDNKRSELLLRESERAWTAAAREPSLLALL